MSDTKYNGWENYETWCVHLWLSNEEPLYRYWRNRAHIIKTTYPATPKPEAELYTSARLALADEMKGTLEEGMPEVDGMWGDLLNAAFEEVDWLEIADAFLEE